MAYEYIRALSKPKGMGTRWNDEDVAETSIRELLEKNFTTLIVLYSDILDREVTLELRDAASLISNPQWTVVEWLVENGNTTLPTANEVPSVRQEQVFHQNAWAAGYHIRPTVRGQHPDNDALLSDMDDLIIEKPNDEDFDYQFMQDHALVTVNGLAHLTSASSYGLHVYDAMKSAMVSGENQLGITTFENIGSFTQVPVQASMVYKNNENQKLHRETYVDLGQPTDGKTVVMVLGGYVHINDGLYREVGDGLIKVDMRRVHLAQRWMESLEWLDLSDLPYTKKDYNEGLIKTEDLLSDEFIKAYFDLSQTFFLLVDNDDLVTEHHLLETTNIPGNFIHHTHPTTPLRSERGKWIEYVTYRDQVHWVVKSHPALDPRYWFETAQWREHNAIDNTELRSEGIEYARAFLLEIVTEEIDWQSTYEE